MAFFREDGVLLSAAISFFFIITIVPFSLLLFSMVGYFLGENLEFYEFFLSVILKYFPGIVHGMTDEISKLIGYRNVGAVSLLLYMGLSFELFSSFESALNKFFKVQRKRPLVFSMFYSLIAVTTIIALLLISFAVTSYIPFLKIIKTIVPKDVEVLVVESLLLQFAIPFAMQFVIFAVLYAWVSHRKYRFRHIIAGALFSAVFTESAKVLFAWYVGSLARLGTIYGPLSFFILFLLWVYYSACIFLVGAALISELGNGKGDREEMRIDGCAVDDGPPLPEDGED